MDIKKYKVIITPTAYNEIDSIYNYITMNLYAEKAAKNLMNKVEEKIQNLKDSPKMYNEIRKIDELKRTYRRMVIDNYVILYTIDESNDSVFVSHMYYGGTNYMNNETF